MDLDPFFLQEFGHGLGVDADVGFAVGYEDDVLVSEGSGKRLRGKQEPLADIGSRKSGNFLPYRIGSNFRNDGKKGFQIGSKGRKEKRLPREHDESETVSVAFRDEFRNDLFRHFYAVWQKVFGEHRLGNVENEDDVGPFFPFDFLHERMPRIGEYRRHGNDCQSGKKRLEPREPGVSPSVPKARRAEIPPETGFAENEREYRDRKQCGEEKFRTEKFDVTHFDVR